ncbi:unnamed protein product [Brassica rapa subsp. narinosa]
MTGPTGSKPAREIFLTSSSLSFSSFSSSCASSDDDDAAIELNIEATSPTSRGKLLKASSRSGSEMSCLTHVTMQPAPSPPSKFRPGSPYDPERIPSSVFGKKAKDVNWSDDSLFSLRMSNYEGFRQSNLMPGDVLMPGEFLAYSPSLKVKPEDVEDEMVKKKKTTSEETNNIHGEMSLSPTPSAYSYPSSFAQLYQAPPQSSKAQSISLPVLALKSRACRSIGAHRSINGSSGCVACYRERSRATETLKDPPPSFIAQNKPNVSEDFWSTSTVDMDNITFPSQGSISSSNQTFDSHSAARNLNAPPEFVNQGLLLWNQTRERWVGKERASNPPERKQGAKINWNAASYDNLLGSNKLFPQPIPLNEMVDFLVEVWEQDGLYD